jgi:hypothetical protein
MVKALGGPVLSHSEVQLPPGVPPIRVSILSLFAFLWGVTLLGTVSLDISSRKHGGRGIATLSRQRPCVPAPCRPVAPPGGHRQLCESVAPSTASVVPATHRQFCEPPSLAHASVVPATHRQFCEPPSLAHVSVVPGGIYSSRTVVAPTELTPRRTFTAPYGGSRSSGRSSSRPAVSS